MKATKRIKQLYASKMFWKRKAIKEQRESADLQCDLVTLSLEVTELEAKLEQMKKWRNNWRTNYYESQSNIGGIR